MLNSAADYKCVDVTGLEGFITGDPLPKRDIRADGSRRAVKYEDALFLAEAWEERCRWNGVPQTREEMRLKRGNLSLTGLTWGTGADESAPGLLSYCIDGEHRPNVDGVYASFMKRDFTFASAYTDIDTGGDATYDIGDFLGGLGVNAIDYEPLTKWRYGGSGHGGKLDADLLRTAYWNLGLAKRTWIGIGGDALISHTTIDRWSSPDGVDIRHDTDEYDGFDGTLYSFGGTGVAGNSLRKPTYTWRSAVDVAWPWVTGAKLLLMVESWRHDLNVRHVDVLTFNCTVANGAISASVDLWQVARETCQRHEIHFYDTYFYTVDKSKHGTVNAVGWAIAAEHAFPAEVESLNWNWEPEGRQ